MNPKYRLLVVSVLVAIASFANGACAQDKPDLTNAGQAKAKRDALEWLAKNKPTHPLIVPDQIIRTNFDKDDYDWSYPARGEEEGDEGKGGWRSITYKYHVVNELRQAMVEAAQAAEDKVFEVWVDKEAALKKKLLEQKHPDKDPEILGAFLTDWFDEATKATKDDGALFKRALLQGAYQITQVVLDVQADQEREAGSRSGTGSPSSGTGTAGTGVVGGYYHSDVIHERLMNGIYRRHNRRMNQITRIRARR